MITKLKRDHREKLSRRISTRRTFNMLKAHVHEQCCNSRETRKRIFVLLEQQQKYERRGNGRREERKGERVQGLEQCHAGEHSNFRV
jgi:hypothetical protein